MIGTALFTACAGTSRPAQRDKHANVREPAMLMTTQQLSRKIKLVAPEFREDAPERYVVKRGDTLWDIAGRFLKNPARWKEIWYANPQIKNPNLIYPGDILSYTTVGGKRMVQIAGSNSPARNRFTGRRTADGRPIYNVVPSVRVEPLYEPIPTIPKDVIFPFMSKNRVIDPGSLEDYPYVVAQADKGFISLTGRQKIYARSETGFDHQFYEVFREAKPIIDPEVGNVLAVEAIYVGELQLAKEANEDGVAEFVQVDSVNPLYPRDVLIPKEKAPAGEDLYFLPKLPEVSENVEVIRAIGTSGKYSASQFSTLLINAGRFSGVTEGDVFKIVRAKAQMGQGRDGEQFQLPDYEVGVGIVYKVEEDMAYLLVMSANDVIYPGDRLITP